MLAHGASFGGVSGDYTCKGCNTKEPTRRDFIMANKTALCMVKGYEVDHEPLMPVHDVQKLILRVPPEEKKIQVAQKARNLADIMDEVMEKKYGAINRQRTERKRRRQERSSERKAFMKVRLESNGLIDGQRRVKDGKKRKKRRKEVKTLGTQVSR